MTLQEKEKKKRGQTRKKGGRKEEEDHLLSKPATDNMRIVEKSWGQRKQKWSQLIKQVNRKDYLATDQSELTLVQDSANANALILFDSKGEAQEVQGSMTVYQEKYVKELLSLVGKQKRKINYMKRENKRLLRVNQRVSTNLQYNSNSAERFSDQISGICREAENHWKNIKHSDDKVRDLLYSFKDDMLACMIQVRAEHGLIYEKMQAFHKQEVRHLREEYEEEIERLVQDINLGRRQLLEREKDYQNSLVSEIHSNLLQTRVWENKTEDSSFNSKSQGVVCDTNRGTPDDSTRRQRSRWRPLKLLRNCLSHQDDAIPLVVESHTRLTSTSPSNEIVSQIRQLVDENRVLKAQLHQLRLEKEMLASNLARSEMLTSQKERRIDFLDNVIRGLFGLITERHLRASYYEVEQEIGTFAERSDRERLENADEEASTGQSTVYHCLIKCRDCCRELPPSMYASVEFHQLISTMATTAQVVFRREIYGPFRVGNYFTQGGDLWQICSEFLSHLGTSNAESAHLMKTLKQCRSNFKKNKRRRTHRHYTEHSKQRLNGHLKNARKRSERERKKIRELETENLELVSILKELHGDASNDNIKGIREMLEDVVAKLPSEKRFSTKNKVDKPEETVDEDSGAEWFDPLCEDNRVVKLCEHEKAGQEQDLDIESSYYLDVLFSDNSNVNEAERPTVSASQEWFEAFIENNGLVKTCKRAPEDQKQDLYLDSSYYLDILFADHDNVNKTDKPTACADQECFEALSDQSGPVKPCGRDKEDQEQDFCLDSSYYLDVLFSDYGNGNITEKPTVGTNQDWFDTLSEGNGVIKPWGQHREDQEQDLYLDLSYYLDVLFTDHANVSKTESPTVGADQESFVALSEGRSVIKPCGQDNQDQRQDLYPDSSFYLDTLFTDHGNAKKSEKPTACAGKKWFEALSEENGLVKPCARDVTNQEECLEIKEFKTNGAWNHDIDQLTGGKVDEDNANDFDSTCLIEALFDVDDGLQYMPGGPRGDQEREYERCSAEESIIIQCEDDKGDESKEEVLNSNVCLNALLSNDVEEENMVVYSMKLKDDVASSKSVISLSPIGRNENTTDESLANRRGNEHFNAIHNKRKYEASYSSSYSRCDENEGKDSTLNTADMKEIECALKERYIPVWLRNDLKTETKIADNNSLSGTYTNYSAVRINHGRSASGTTVAVVDLTKEERNDENTSQQRLSWFSLPIKKLVDYATSEEIGHVSFVDLLIKNINSLLYENDDRIYDQLLAEMAFFRDVMINADSHVLKHDEVISHALTLVYDCQYESGTFRYNKGSECSRPLQLFHILKKDQGICLLTDLQVEALSPNEMQTYPRFSFSLKTSSDLLAADTISDQNTWKVYFYLNQGCQKSRGKLVTKSGVSEISIPLLIISKKHTGDILTCRMCVSMSGMEGLCLTLGIDFRCPNTNLNYESMASIYTDRNINVAQLVQKLSSSYLIQGTRNMVNVSSDIGQMEGERLQRTAIIENNLVAYDFRSMNDNFDICISSYPHHMPSDVKATCYCSAVQDYGQRPTFPTGRFYSSHRIFRDRFDLRKIQQVLCHSLLKLSGDLMIIYYPINYRKSINLIGELVLQSDVPSLDINTRINQLFKATGERLENQLTKEKENKRKEEAVDSSDDVVQYFDSNEDLLRSEASTETDASIKCTFVEDHCYRFHQRQPKKINSNTCDTNRVTQTGKYQIIDAKYEKKDEGIEKEGASVIDSKETYKLPMVTGEEELHRSAEIIASSMKSSLEIKNINKDNMNDSEDKTTASHSSGPQLSILFRIDDSVASR